MSLLDQNRIDFMLRLARERGGRKVEVMRSLMFRDGQVPPGMVMIDTPEKKALYARHLSRQSKREEAGAPGDIHQTLLNHPAVQEFIAQPPEVP